MKGFESMKEMKIETTKYTKYTKKNAIMRKCISCTLCISWLKNAMMLVIIVLVWAANAATGTSEEFRMDLSGMGPWEMRTARVSEAISYSSAWATNALVDAKAVVRVYPVKREKPKYIAIDLSGGTAATHYPIEYLDEIPGGSWSDEYKTSKLVLRHIPAGSFIMGGRNTDYPGAVNTNLHMVTLTKDFYMGVFEVTQRQWELVMGNRPSAFSNETCYATRPVESVSYVDIRGGVKGITWPESKDVDEYSFMGQLRKKIGLTGFDLPTEAQWEYACRAGTTTALNSGKNISNTHTDSADAIVDPAADEVARYHVNSGAKKYESVESFILEHSNDDVINGSAKVGSYMPNKLELYDFHGNVYEFCLDAFSEFSVESVDPIGTKKSSWRLIRGGSWFSGSYAYASFYRGASRRDDTSISTVGFRLCLQGGELPEVDDSVTLVNDAGSGAANWTPTKAGTYYLTHETETNGMNGAEVLDAWFTVDAPKLTFVPDGDLTPGVKVAIAGAADGWTVRYTTNGASPTSSSLEYTEPITLNDSAAIRAVAFSDGGLESLEYSATFSLMSVGGAVARPRYPWSGNVDIDVTVKGAENEDYLFSLVARDLDGGTNLPLRTVWQAGGTITNNAFLVKPGAHRFTWDAAADITNDCEFANVVVNVSAEQSEIIAAKKVLTLEVAGYAGSETLTNVPVLVRISTSIDGFSYADFVDAKGGDLVFTDESGSIVYPYEIDEWHTDGESLVWVKLPRMVNGTKFKMAYGNQKLETRNQKQVKHEVWRDYAGVWHMNEDSGTAYDSTANGLDGIPNGITDGIVDVMLSYNSGACGKARVSGIEYGHQSSYCVPSYDGLNIGAKFIASGWYRADRVEKYPKFFYRNDDSWLDGGWGAELCDGSPTNVTVVGGSNQNSLFIPGGEAPTVIGSWVSYSFGYDGEMVSFYTNGVFSQSGEITPVSDNGRMLRIAMGLIGQCDEIRLRGGSLSPDRIKADYDMIVNRNFLRYGPVESGKGVVE